MTATTGCLIFNNATMPDIFGLGLTATVNAAFSFNTSCNWPNNPCTSLPNNDATGGGTYVINDASGATVETGTITTNGGALGAYEGLDGVNTNYREADTLGTPTTCREAADRQVAVYGSTGLSTDPWVELFAATPSNEVAFSTSNGDETGEFFDGFVDGSGITLIC